MRRSQSAVLVLAMLVAVAAWATAGETARPFHVVIANDDGVDAPGIAALAAVLAADPAYRVTVVAPAEAQSGMSHAVVLEDLIRARAHSLVAGCPAWAVDATPATTVRVALTGILAADRPELVLSGINRGENVGLSAWYSGTIGAAREAVLAGLPAIAFSLQLDWSDPRPDFTAAARWAKPVVDAVRQGGLPAGVLLNVNIPRDTSAIRGFRLARMSLAPDQVDRYDLDHEEGGQRWYRGMWTPPVETEPGADTRELAQGWVTVVPLGLDQTSFPVLVVVGELCLAPLPLPAPVPVP